MDHTVHVTIEDEDGAVLGHFDVSADVESDAELADMIKEAIGDSTLPDLEVG